MTKMLSLNLQLENMLPALSKVIKAAEQEDSAMAEYLTNVKRYFLNYVNPPPPLPIIRQQTVQPVQYTDGDLEGDYDLYEYMPASEWAKASPSMKAMWPKMSLEERKEWYRYYQPEEEEESQVVDPELDAMVQRVQAENPDMDMLDVYKLAAKRLGTTKG